MKDKGKTNGQLIREPAAMRKRIGELEALGDEPKDVEGILSESETKYRALFEKSVDPILLLEGERFADCNEAALRLLRCPNKDKLVGLRPSQISPERQPDGQFSAEKERKTFDLAERNESFQFEWVHRAFDGKDLWVEVSLTTIPITGKLMAHVIWRDISEQKQTEKALTEAEEKYRNIFENAVEGIFQTTPDGRFLAANPALAGMYGFESPRELIETITNIENRMYVDPADRERLRRLYEEQGFVRNFETRLYRKDGSILWISMTGRAVRGSDGKTVCYEGMAEDITIRKQAEETLRELNQRLHDIIDFLPDPTFGIDMRGKVIFWNRAMEEMTGVKAVEILGKGDHEYSIPFYGTRRPMIVDMALAPHEEFKNQYSYVSKENGYIVAEGYVPFPGREGKFLWGKVAPICSTEGNVVGAIESVRDITGHRRTEQELRNHKEHLEELVEERTVGLNTANELLQLEIAERTQAETELKEYRDHLERLVSERTVELTKSEKKYRDLVDNALVAIYKTNIRGDHLYGNEALARMLEFESLEDLLPTPVSERYKNPEDRKSFIKCLKETGKVFNFELELVTMTGKTRNVLLNAILEGDEISGMMLDITDRKESEQELKMKSLSLEELNAALRVLLEQRQKDKNELEDNIFHNVKELVLPYIDTLRQRHLDEQQKMYLDVLDKNLKNIISPLIQKMRSVYASFTPAEIKVANLVREGKTAKEIAVILGVAETSINTHKQRIRNKLGLAHQKTNLKTYLMSLE
jgi:PAS domain S-box-containing protein